MDDKDNTNTIPIGESTLQEPTVLPSETPMDAKQVGVLCDIQEDSGDDEDSEDEEDDRECECNKEVDAEIDRTIEYYREHEAKECVFRKDGKCNCDWPSHGLKELAQTCMCEHEHKQTTYAMDKIDRYIQSRGITCGVGEWMYSAE